MSGGRWPRILLALALAELAAHGALALLARVGVRFEPLPTRSLSAPQREALQTLLSGEARYTAHDLQLGWTIAPGGAAGLYHATAEGARMPAPEPPAPGVRRVLALGDSFTHGDEVEDAQSWPAALAEAPDLAVLNLGVPGYSPVQAMLRWRALADREPADLVIFGLVSADLPRTPNHFPPFLDPSTALALPRPAARLTEAGLEIRPNPLPRPEDLRLLLEDPGPTLARLGAGDPCFEAGPHQGALDGLGLARLLRLSRLRLSPPLPCLPGEGALDAQSPAFRATAELLARWDAEIQARGQRLLVLMLPTASDLAALERGEPAPSSPLQRWLLSHGLWVEDATGWVRAIPEGGRFRPGGHYTPEVNRAIGAGLSASDLSSFER